MMKAPPVPAAKPAELIGVIRYPWQKKAITPQPRTEPTIPISVVPNAPPGSLPGMMALAANPTSVPKPTHKRTSWAAFCRIRLNWGVAGIRHLGGAVQLLQSATVVIVHRPVSAVTVSASPQHMEVDCPKQSTVSRLPADNWKD